MEKNERETGPGPAGGCSAFRLGLVLGSLSRRLEASRDQEERDRLQAEIDEIERNLGLS